MNTLASAGQLRASLLRWALFIVPAVVALGFLSGMFAGSGPGNAWFDGLQKPSIYPPPAAFGIVWTVLYVLMGLALAMVMSARGAMLRGPAAIAFLVQFVLNLAWSPLFFGAHRITAALVLLVVLDVAVAVTLVLFWKVRRAAGLLMVPYLAWVCFATALNWEFRELNPGADGQETHGAAVQMNF